MFTALKTVCLGKAKGRNTKPAQSWLGSWSFAVFVLQFRFRNQLGSVCAHSVTRFLDPEKREKGVKKRLDERRKKDFCAKYL